MKKLISLLLALMMCLSLLPLTALAAEEELIETTEETSEETAEEATEESTEETGNEAAEEATEEAPASLDGASTKATSGSCGDNLTWTLKAGVLTISGTGTMTDYSPLSDTPAAPWNSSKASIRTVEIGDGVTSIGAYAFRDCTALWRVTLPDGITRIGDQAFQNCNALKSIDIPDSLTSLGDAVFYNCTSLTSVTIPGGVKSIEPSLFSGCTALESVTIQDGVESIGYYAFENCTALKSMTFPDSVASIGGNAFSGCTALESITLPNSITTIQNYAFEGCTALTAVHYEGSEQEKTAIKIGSGNTPLEQAVWECATQGISISAATVVIGKKTDGSIAVTVKLDGATLTEGTDYTVATTETDGSISVTVTGCNDYCDKATASLDYIPGDVNGDGAVTIQDVLTLLKYVASIADIIIY